MVSAIVMLKARLLAKVQMARKPKEPRKSQVKNLKRMQTSRSVSITPRAAGVGETG